MTKVYCADVTCAFNGDDEVCQAKNISLSSNSVVTRWDGRQEYHRCTTYVKSDEAIHVENFLKEKGIIPNENH